MNRIVLTFLCLLAQAGMTFAQTPTLQFGGRNETTGQQDFVSSLAITAGQKVQLQWTATVVNYCQASWRVDRMGIASADEVVPTASTNYSLTCYGPNGNVSRTVQVTVGSGSVVPTVQITYPNGQTFVPGSIMTITWTSTNATSQSVQVSLNNRASWTEVFFDTGTARSFNWTVPNQPGTVGYVRVYVVRTVGTDKTDAFSESSFTIAGTQTAPTVSLTYPNGQFIAAGTTINITWNGANATSYTLAYSTNNRASYTNIATVGPSANPQSMSWQVPTLANGTIVWVRVLATNAYGTASEERTFTAGINDSTPPFLQVTNPAPGATLSGMVLITATATDNVQVAGVQYFLDSLSQFLGPEITQAPYQLNWNTASSSNGAHILIARARDTANNTTTQQFNITLNNLTTPGFAITAPTAGQTFQAGQTMTTAWTPMTGATYYNVYLALDGTNFNTLTQNLPASTLSYSFIPTASLATTQARIRIIGFVSANQFQVADSGIFTIAAPTPAPLTIEHAGSYQQGLIAPELIITLFGPDLATTTVAPSLPQTKLDGTQVTVGGSLCFLFFVSPGQINCQVPDGVPFGTATVQVVRDGKDTLSATVSVSDSFPGLFQDAMPRAAITRANTYTWVGGSDIVNGGDYLTAWGTGFTPLSPPVPAGQPAPVLPPWSLVQAKVELMVNGVTYTDAVKFAGAGPGLVGVQQINFQIPAGLPKGQNKGTLLFNGQQVQPSFYFTTP